MKQVPAGFSLVEITLALGVAAVSLLAIFGLLATGSQVNHTAIEQTSSTDILTAVAADLRATPKTSPPGGATVSLQFVIPVPQNPVSSATVTTLYFDAKGQSSTAIGPGSRYRLTVTFVPNGPGVRTASFADLRMTWPAGADPTNINTSAAETFVALDRN